MQNDAWYMRRAMAVDVAVEVNLRASTDERPSEEDALAFQAVRQTEGFVDEGYLQRVIRSSSHRVSDCVERIGAKALIARARLGDEKTQQLVDLIRLASCAR